MTSAIILVRATDKVRVSLYSANIPFCCSGMQDHDDLSHSLKSIEGVERVELRMYSAVFVIDARSDWASVESQVIELISAQSRWEDAEVELQRLSALRDADDA